MAAMQLRVPALAMLAVLLAACGGHGKPSARAPGAAADAAERQSEGQLLVLGVETQALAPLLADFESRTRCKVELREAADAADLIEEATQEDADLVLASGENASSLVSAGLVQGVDGKRLPKISSIEARLRAHAGSVADGHRYGVAWRWQPVGLAYVEAKQAPPPASWQMLYEPVAGKDGNAAQVLGGAGPIAIADAALYLASTRPELGIRDPYALDETQYAQVLELLKRQRLAWRGSGGDVAEAAEAFRNGIAAAPATPATVRALHKQGLPVAWVLPTEGGTAQVEIAMLHSQAKHPNCAYAWMQWALEPKVQARLAAAAGALPAEAEACKLEPLALGDACMRDGMALLPRLYLQRVPQANCGKATCVPYSRWTRDFLALAGE